MLRYLAYLVLSLTAHVFAFLLSPVLPLFAVERVGPLNNATTTGSGPRLPIWLSWFDTPDNSLDGDSRFIQLNGKGYWQKVRWLRRNRVYGLNWTVLSAKVEKERTVIGSPDIGYQGSRFGTLKIVQPNGAWQYKTVFPLFGRVFEGNFGWLLDDTSKQQALFTFSPRFKKAV